MSNAGHVTEWEVMIIWYGDTFQISKLCNWSQHVNGLNSYNKSGQGPILYVDDTDQCNINCKISYPAVDHHRVHSTSIEVHKHEYW